MFFTLESILGALAITIVGWAFKAIISKFFTDGSNVTDTAKNFLFTALLILIGFYASKIIEISLKIQHIDKKVSDVLEMQLNANKYFEAREAINSLSEESSLKMLLEKEWQAIGEKLNQIDKKELFLKREEIIPKWEDLIKNSNYIVWATNVVSIEEWKKFSPTEGKEVHSVALKNGVEIRRIFIYSGSKDSNYVKLENKAKEQKKWGVEVRIISSKWINESPYVSELLKDIGSIDIVIFDEESVLFTNVDNSYNMISATLTTNLHRLQKSKEFYEKLWAEADKIN